MIGEAGRSALGSRGQKDGWAHIVGSVGGIRCKSWMLWGQGGKKGWESQVNKRV